MVQKTEAINNHFVSRAKVWESNGRRSGYRPRSPFFITDLRIVKADPPAQWVSSEAAQLVPQTMVDLAVNKSYARFKSDVMSSSQVGASLAEARQSMSMVTNRLTQLLTFTRQVKKLHLRDAAKTLGIIQPKKRTVKSVSKDFGDTFLEFHFGWTPLVKDIYDSVDVLQSAPKPITARGRGRESSTLLINDPTLPSYGRTRKIDYWVKVQHIADIRVSNPNLLLATRLGLTNPASIAWELVPFSFVGDWIGTVGEFLASWTDFDGLEFIQPMTTVMWKSSVDDHQKYLMPWDPPVSKTIERFELRRTRGIANPSILWRSPKPLSASRGLTAASLLTQLLKGH